VWRRLQVRDHSRGGKRLVCSSPHVVSWSSTPFYVVGEATAAVLSSIRKDYQDSHFAPNLIRGGSEAGTAQRLASFILEDLDTTSPRKLLYLTGDKNLKTLPDILNDAGNIGLESLQVYQTRGSSRVASAVDEAVQSTEEGDKLTNLGISRTFN
jgi:uroporphyrinogen-III synthase